MTDHDLGFPERFTDAERREAVSLMLLSMNAVTKGEQESSTVVFAAGRCATMGVPMATIQAALDDLSAGLLEQAKDELLRAMGLEEPEGGDAGVPR